MITTTTYKAELDDEISFEVGVLVTVIEKNFDGWWLIRWVLSMSTPIIFTSIELSSKPEMDQAIYVVTVSY